MNSRNDTPAIRIANPNKPALKLNLDGTVTLLPEKTRKQALDRLKSAGISIPVWCAANGFSVATAKAVLYGHCKGERGESHRIAVAIGLKQGSCPAAYGFMVSTPVRATAQNSAPRITGKRPA